jgi:hypothetical protein
VETAVARQAHDEKILQALIEANLLLVFIRLRCVEGIGAALWIAEL